jgi:hypothetical protein
VRGSIDSARKTRNDDQIALGELCDLAFNGFEGSLLWFPGPDDREAPFRKIIKKLESIPLDVEPLRRVRDLPERAIGSGDFVNRVVGHGGGTAPAMPPIPVWNLDLGRPDPLQLAKPTGFETITLCV